jgi:hypothetical protein
MRTIWAQSFIVIWRSEGGEGPIIEVREDVEFMVGAKRVLGGKGHAGDPQGAVKIYARLSRE